MYKYISSKISNPALGSLINSTFNGQRILYTTSLLSNLKLFNQTNNKDHQNNNNNNNNNKGFEFKSNNNNKDQYNKLNGREGLLISFSIGSLFGGWTKKQDDMMTTSFKRQGKETIESIQEAMEWYQTYYQHKESQYFLDAMVLLLGKESQQYIKEQLSHIKQNHDLKSVAKLQNIQSFYYLPMVGFITEMMRTNPELINTWYSKLMENPDITTPWKSVLGNLDPSMLLTLSICLLSLDNDNQNNQNNNQNNNISKSQQIAQEIQRTIVISNLNKSTKQEPTTKSIDEGLQSLQSWAKKQKESLPTYPLLLIGQYLCSGDEEIVKKIIGMWRKSLDYLEKTTLSNTAASNTSNDINKKMEFEQREMIIDELSQAIRLLSKDKKAADLLRSELNHHLNKSNERK